MEGSERGGRRPAEPASRWRSLLGRGRLRQTEEPEVVDRWIASIRSTPNGEEFPPEPPANGSPQRSVLDHPSVVDHLSPPEHGRQPVPDPGPAGHPAFTERPGLPAGAGHQQPETWTGYGEPAPGTGARPSGESPGPAVSRYELLDPGFATEPPDSESRYAALEPGYVPPLPATVDNAAVEGVQRGRRQPPPWAEPAGPPAWAEPAGPPAWAEPSGPPAWAEPAGPPAWAEPSGPQAWAEPAGPPAWADPSGPRGSTEPGSSEQPWAHHPAAPQWSEPPAPARSWDERDAPPRPWTASDAAARTWGVAEAPAPAGERDDAARSWGERDAPPRPWAAPDAPARPWAEPAAPALPAGEPGPSDKPFRPWGEPDLPARPRMEPDEHSQPREGPAAAAAAAVVQPAVGRARAAVRHVIPAPRTPDDQLPVPQRWETRRSEPPGQPAGPTRSQLPGGAPDPDVERAIELLRRDLGRPRVIAFANPKGGVHKTTATVLAAATVGSVRGRGVLAWDDNELRGTLGLRAGSARHARTVRHLVADLALIEESYGTQLSDRLDQYLRHASDSSYDVLAGEESPRFAQRLDRHTVQRVLELLRRTHDVICVDTGNNVESVNWQTVMQAADQLVVTTVPREDAAFTADWMLDLLHEIGMGELADNAVTLLSCATRERSPLLDDLAAHFATRTRAVQIVPYDLALETGSSIEYGRLQHETRQAWLRACAGTLEPFAR